MAVLKQCLKSDYFTHSQRVIVHLILNFIFFYLNLDSYFYLERYVGTMSVLSKLLIPWIFLNNYNVKKMQNFKMCTCHPNSVIVSIDTGRNLNVHNTIRRRPGRFLNVLCTFNLRPVSTGVAHPEEKIWVFVQSYVTRWKLSHQRLERSIPWTHLTGD